MAKNLRQLRHEREWSQKDLATYVGVSQSTITQWENGHKFPDKPNIDRLAEVFGISQVEVFAAALQSDKRTPQPPAPALAS